jgi:Ca2+-binding EF-hand superfamily protein
VIDDKKVKWLVPPHATETRSSTIPTKDELKSIFQKAYALYNQKDSGALSRAEIKNLFNHAFAGLNMPGIGDSQIEALIDSIDEDHDGTFSLNELTNLIGPILDLKVRNQEKILSSLRKLVDKDSNLTCGDSGSKCKVLNHHALIEHFENNFGEIIDPLVAC